MTAGTELSITFLSLFMTFGLFFLAAKDGYVKNQYADLIIRRVFLMIAILYLSTTASIILELASTAGLTAVLDDLKLMVIITSWAGYLAMFIVMITTLTSIVKMYLEYTQEKRTGFFKW